MQDVRLEATEKLAEVVAGDLCTARPLALCVRPWAFSLDFGDAVRMTERICFDAVCFRRIQWRKEWWWSGTLLRWTFPYLEAATLVP